MSQPTDPSLSTDSPDSASRRSRAGVWLVRYGIAIALLLAGQLLLLFDVGSSKAEGWALLTGAGLSVLLLNMLHRTGVSGDHERDDEEQARQFFDTHGRWPDEPPLPGEETAQRPKRRPPPEPITPDVRHPGQPGGGRPASMRPTSPRPRRRGPSH